MKKFMSLSLLMICLAGAVACSKKKNVVNSAAGTGFINPFGGFPTTGGASTAYMNSLSVTSQSVFENLMAEIFGVCQKWGQFGTGDCASHSTNAEIYLEQVGFGQTNQVTTNNAVWVTVYAGYARIPLTFQTSYWPTNNNTGFELRTNVPFKVISPAGQWGQDSFQVQVLYNNAQFATGWVSKVR